MNKNKSGWTSDERMNGGIIRRMKELKKTRIEYNIFFQRIESLLVLAYCVSFKWE